MLISSQSIPPCVCLWVRHWVTNFIPQIGDIGRSLIPRCLHKWQVHFITGNTPMCVSVSQTLSHELHSSSWRYRKVANPMMSTYVTCSFHHSQNPHVCLWVRHWVTNYIPQLGDIGRSLIPRCLHKWQVHFVMGVTLAKRPYTQESRQQDPVTLWSR